VDIAQITETLREDAAPVVFINVLLQQLGLPVPAVPTMLLAGSLAATPELLGKLLAAAVLASVIADWVWYWSGRVFGYRVLAGLCKLSINPSSCVSQTEARFIRWGLSSLVVAKFIPGFSTVAPPIAGALRMSQLGFLLASGIGAVLGVGLLLQDTVQTAIAVLDEHANRAAILVVLGLAVWLSWKFWQKYRFRKFCAVPHITPSELMDALSTDTPPLVLDLRGPLMIAEVGSIVGATGARETDIDRLHRTVEDWPKDRPIVTLCACPEDATAIKAARSLLNAGYLSVRPLKGGYDAWVKTNSRDDA
jgi:membrane protein DedA with SNARE-associated domain/rhodanese-related sulfurtransferase